MIEFGPHTRKLMRPCTLVFLLQPLRLDNIAFKLTTEYKSLRIADQIKYEMITKELSRKSRIPNRELLEDMARRSES